MTPTEQTTSLQRRLPDPAATEALGQALARTLPTGNAIVFLDGDLGSGKTTLVRALLRALDVSGPIRSPTYTLVERYPLAAGGEAAHLDLYRIADPDELDYLALDELAASARLWLVEWPRRGAGRLPRADLCLRLAAVGTGREVEIVAASTTGARWLADLRRAG